MKMLRITLQGKTYEVGVEVLDSESATPAPAPVQTVAAVAVASAVSAPAPAAAPPAPAAANANAVTSPMPGVVMKLNVTVGQQVAQDQVVLVLEAMKMESPIYAPHAGTIASILVKEGDAVVEGQILVQLN